MADHTNIEWCDATLNPWIGCTKVSPGCDNCYAARQDNFRHWTPEGWGGPRKRTSEATWRLPTLWNKQAFVECMGCGWRGEAREGDLRAAAGMHPPAEARHCPRCELPVLKAARRRVFCASLADVFDNQVPIEWRRDLFDLIELTPDLDWLLLTKRIGNVADMVREARSWDWLLGRSNVWLGATVVNQEEADRDIVKLMRVPARVRFLSCEPLLGPVDLAGIPHPNRTKDGPAMHLRALAPNGVGAGVHWVIAGGESGHGARPAHPDWFRSLRDQCAAADVPFLHKQNGEWASVSEYAGEGQHYRFEDGATVRRIGKKAAGRLLDGVTHNGFPGAARG